jgi:hypothetical protein
MKYPPCNCTDPEACTSCVNYCPTCLRNGVPTRMERHGRAWVCPVQRDEEKRVSEKTKQGIRTMVAERVAGVSF